MPKYNGEQLMHNWRGRGKEEKGKKYRMRERERVKC